ncbi:MAG TPA: peroxidase family protein, partial [Methylomirabilota bacterium]|nr:peroxidase family protein [Methylomirabilota bacterium]
MAITLIRSDLEFILQQIIIAEKHAAGADLLSLLPNSLVPFGLRTVDGSFNHLLPGQENLGAADQLFPQLTDQTFRDALVDPDGPGPAAAVPGSYDATSGFVVDPQPRIISNLIADQTTGNPAASAAAGATVAPGPDGILGTNDDVIEFDPASTSSQVTSPGLDGIFGTADDVQNLFLIPNTAPDAGLSAPFNLWFVFFGQFFDHGLDLVQKGGSGTVFIPLQPDDPLFVPGSQTNFMLLTRATNQPGPDGILGTDDDIHEHVNTTSPFVDQNQTFASDGSHQAFLREYELRGGDPFATGKLITNRNLVDGIFGNGNDINLGGMSTWAVVKAQARDLLGIELTDKDVVNVPKIAVDLYGNFIPGANGFAQLVTVGPDLLPGTADDGLLERTVAGPALSTNPAGPDNLFGTADDLVFTGQMFLADIAHSANPFNSQGILLTPDADTGIGDDGNPATYDNELLDRHFMAGDGRVNENIGLTAVHHIFHSEHNRLVDHIKAQILATGDAAFISEWRNPTTLEWDGERLFQAAKFGTEMQYQHLVFEEFARKVQPNIDEFLVPNGFDTFTNPAIVAEFAHTVYRFGHSMLLETIDRLDPNFVSSEIGLITAFLNPLAFNNDGGLTPEQAAGAIVRGTTRQVANEIDEFKTEAMRNNLLGLPLDLAAINLARGRDTGIPALNEARRQFHEATGDSDLAPYTSWNDFVQHMKHPESLVNFIAAYGTHASITAATTVDTKRAAAADIVFGGGAVSDAERLAFLNESAATSGVNDIDFWMGGLAEKQMPFGGLLGSTFNFVFELQLESLQSGDRFYYLARLAGTNFVNELENNSFAKLIMANTNTTHLPGDVFSTPGFILEVTQANQFNEGLGSADPVAEPGSLIPLVIRSNANSLQYNGADHVVLGGTTGNDSIISSEGDDTLYGDAGNDRLEGGYGNDMLLGGPGDDIITDIGGDDNIQAEDGNDVIHGGNGLNLILGGRGSDFIITGEDVTETFGGEGNDFILGAKTNLPSLGNEGDDWIEIGTQDGAPGDNFDPFSQDRVTGNDVFITAGGFDEPIAEGGDDIMVGSDGEDHFDGASGFDWATFQFDRFGVQSDM